MGYEVINGWTKAWAGGQVFYYRAKVDEQKWRDELKIIIDDKDARFDHKYENGLGDREFLKTETLKKALEKKIAALKIPDVTPWQRVEITQPAWHWDNDGKQMLTWEKDHDKL